jgi:hypothetical protein
VGQQQQGNQGQPVVGSHQEAGQCEQQVTPQIRGIEVTLAECLKHRPPTLAECLKHNYA